MIHGIYSVLDAAAGAYGVPWFAPTDAHAMRSFQDLCLDPETVPGRHPADFSLYRIGSFNLETAELRPADLSVLANGAAVVTEMPDA